MSTKNAKSVDELCQASGMLVYADRVVPWLWERHEEILAAMDLQAPVQRKNLRTVLTALEVLWRTSSVIHRLDRQIDVEARIIYGIAHTAELMHFHGRWERINDKPLVIADIGHNAHALASNFKALEAMNRPLIIVYGIMADKDLDSIIPLMPRSAKYIFVAPDTPRARAAEDILQRVRDFSTSLEMTKEAPEMAMTTAPSVKAGMEMAMTTAPSVKAGMEMAIQEAADDTVIYIGGSTFVVAEVL